MQRSEKDKRRYVKITVLLMLDLGFSVEHTANALGIDGATVYRYLEIYDDAENLGDYLHDQYVPYTGKLSPHQCKELQQHMRSTLYRSSAEVVAYIAEQYGIRYTTSGIVPLLKRLGFVYKKTHEVPAKADPVAQQAFVEQLDALLDGCDRRQDAVYFCDAVHPQHNTRGCYGWITSGQTFDIPTNTGRERVNINGALNAHDVTDIVVREDER
ncbi:MAG: winged helix-turn-helix domain-containing protein, partial [Candidatus Kapaibacterium sp.]